MAATSAEGKESEVKELTDKLNKLEKKMSVDGGFTGERPSAEKGFDDLSDKDQELFLRKAAANLDDTMKLGKEVWHLILLVHYLASIRIISARNC